MRCFSSCPLFEPGANSSIRPFSLEFIYVTYRLFELSRPIELTTWNAVFVMVVVGLMLPPAYSTMLPGAKLKPLALATYTVPFVSTATATGNEDRGVRLRRRRPAGRVHGNGIVVVVADVEVAGSVDRETFGPVDSGGDGSDRRAAFEVPVIDADRVGVVIGNVELYRSVQRVQAGDIQPRPPSGCRSNGNRARTAGARMGIRSRNDSR